MPTTTDAIRIKGLNEFQRSLKLMDGHSQKVLRTVFNTAAELVVTAARPMVPERTGRAAASLKVASQQRKAQVKGGSARAPYYPWLDFGGRVGRNKSVHRPFIKDGRYMYVAYKAEKPAVEKALAEGLEQLVKSSGLEIG